MKIDKIFIKGFGLLSDQQIELAPHVNIIYGENERGKSTLHSFIEQMFYHPYKTGYKKRQLTEVLERYKPWGHNKYSGSLTITDGVQRTIEKDFSSKYPKVSIYDDAGNELSDSYQLDEVYREPKFGQQHFGLSKIMFKNSVSIGQIAKQTDQQAVDELKRYVGNIEKTNDATISVQNVKAKIEQERQKIGKKTRKQSSYGKRETRLNELTAARQQAESTAVEISALEAQAQQRRQEIELAQARLKQIDRQLAAIKQQEDNQLKQKADQLVQQIAQLTAQADALQRYRPFNYEQVSQLNHLKEELHSAEQALEHQQQAVERLTAERQKLNATGKTDNLADLQAERANLKEHIKQLDAIKDKAATVNLQIEQLKAKCAAPLKGQTVSQWLFLSVAALTLGLAFFVSKFNIYLAGAVLATLLPSALFLFKRRKKQLIEAQQRQADLQQLKQLQAELTDSNQRRAAILADCQVADISQLDDKLTELNDAITLAKWQHTENQKNERQKAALTDKLAQAQQTLATLQNDVVNLNRRKAQLFSTLDIATFEVIDQCHEKYRQLIDIEQSGSHLADLLAESLAGRKLEDLQFVELAEPVDSTLKPQLIEERSTVERLHIEKVKEREQISRQIDGLKHNSRSLQSIEEEIEQLLKQRAADDKRLQILDIIDTKIDLAIDNVQRTVMPEVNQTIGQIVTVATAGKYDDIKVNGQLGVFVSDRQNAKTVPIEQLSAGTIDLLYIGLRIAVAGLLNDNKPVPLLFDDTFSQIDDRRLTNLLQYLAQLDRQIIIFTCQQREQQILDQLAVGYHLVKL